MSFNSRSLPRQTADQLRRWELIREKGCITCRKLDYVTECELHHLKSGNLRMGHDFTVGLCAYHHRGDYSWTGQRSLDVAELTFGPSLAARPNQFHAEFGSDAELLKYQNELIGWTKPPERQRKRKSKCTPSSKTIPRRVA